MMILISPQFILMITPLESFRGFLVWFYLNILSRAGAVDTRRALFSSICYVV